MTVRRWVTNNVEAEGTFRWAAAHLIKYVAEGILAGILGGLASLIVFALLAIREFSLPVGVAGPVALWVVLAGLAFGRFTHCKYTNLS